jgi:hypothetical protein
MWKVARRRLWRTQRTIRPCSSSAMARLTLSVERCSSRGIS